jgi:hypothetical protein
LKNLGFMVRMKTPCRFPTHLESLAASPHKVFTQYNPEIFAGLIYRIMKEPECTFLVFVSGKIVVTGAKSLEIITSAANCIYPILQQFARNNDPSMRLISVSQSKRNSSDLTPGWRDDCSDRTRQPHSVFT